MLLDMTNAASNIVLFPHRQLPLACGSDEGFRPLHEFTDRLVRRLAMQSPRSSDATDSREERPGGARACVSRPTVSAEEATRDGMGIKGRDADAPGKVEAAKWSASGGRG